MKELNAVYLDFKDVERMFDELLSLAGYTLKLKATGWLRLPKTPGNPGKIAIFINKGRL